MKKTSAYARKRGLSTVPKSDRWAFIEARKSNGITMNNERNTLLTPAEVQHLLTDPTAGLAGLRSGRGSYDNILSLNAVLKKGQAIEDARVIVRGFAGIYGAADHAIQTICARATKTGKWVPTALYGAEIAALDDLMWAYRQVLQVVTYQEFYKRQAVAIARELSAGEKVFRVGEKVEFEPKEEATC